MDLHRLFSNQTWWGKVLCAFLGYLIAGPIGVFFGIFIGNLFDRGLVGHFNNPMWHYHAERRQAAKKIFIEATFSILGHIAKADGRVSEREIQMAKNLMQQMNLNREQRAAAQFFFNEGKKENFNLNQMLHLLQKAIGHNQHLVKLFIDTQYAAAQLDGLSGKKIQILNTLLNYMRRAPIHEQSRFYEDYYQTNHHQRSSWTNQEPPTKNAPHSLDSAYAILQVPSTANKQDVKRAYRRLISKNHPDKLIAQGLSKEKIKLANEKTQTICKAYEQICTSKGW